MRASRSLIVNPIAGDTLVIDLESLAFKGRWILPNLVGGVDQMRDIDRAPAQEVRDDAGRWSGPSRVRW